MRAVSEGTCVSGGYMSKTEVGVIIKRIFLARNMLVMLDIDVASLCSCSFPQAVLFKARPIADEI